MTSPCVYVTASVFKKAAVAAVSYFSKLTVIYIFKSFCTNKVIRRKYAVCFLFRFGNAQNRIITITNLLNAFVYQALFRFKLS